jgi:DNA-binding transcriptional LysR family regulator
VFRLAIVPGVTVDKWARAWAERQPQVALRVTPIEPGTPLPPDADAGLLRLPVDRDVFHAVPLYTEATVVVVPREHLVAAADEVTLDDLTDDTVLCPLDDVLGLPPLGDRPATTETAVALVAAQVGVLVVPQSLARLHHRKDLTYRVVTDAPTSSVALVWRRDGHTDLVEEMIGIVRGRTANSTRGRAPQPAPLRRGASRRR